MMKTAYFDTYWGPGWPEPQWLERYFLTLNGRHDLFADGGDGGVLSAQGVDGSGTLPQHKGRRDVSLYISAHPELGVTLLWRKTGLVPVEAYYSKGDARKLLERVKDVRGYMQPAGLYIPFEKAWLAIKEFMDRGAALPSCIEWIRDVDLPKDTFAPP
jgi:hypothetical protein